MKHPSLPDLRPLFIVVALISSAVYADEPPPAASPTADSSTATAVPTRHQLMKDCMAKQKAAGSGKPKWDLSQDCREITKTEKENAEANKKQADGEQAAQKPAPR